MMEKKSRILLVDDSEVFVATVVRFLERFDDLVVSGVAHNGQQALELAKTSEFDVILLDLVMPGLGGLDLMPLLRQLQPHAGLIIVTLMAIHEIRAIAGADGYVEKGRLANDLIPAIRRGLIAGSRSGSETAGEIISAEN